MDGSYQNPYHRGHADSPLSPDTPQSASYKANVNRTKTRKWVEAKAQNYDGDDWGDDDFGDEPQPVPSVPALRPGGSRQASYSSNNRLPSGPSVPSQPQAQQQSPYYQQPPAEKPRDAGPPPVLTIQTQDDQPPVAPPQVIAPDADPAGSTERDALERKESPPVEAFTEQAPIIDSQPAHQPDKPVPFVRPSDIYRRMEQDPASGSSHPESFNAQEDVGSKSALGSNEPPAPAQPHPVLQHPQPQTSTSDPNASEHQHGPQFTQHSDAPNIEEPKRFSTSPQLPDLARMSMFGDDLFSGQNRFSVAAPASVSPVREEPHSPSPTTSATANQPIAEPAKDTVLDAGSLTRTESQDEPQTADSKPDDVAAVEPSSKIPSLEDDAMLQPPQSRPSLPGEWVSDSAQPSDPEPAKEPVSSSVKDTVEDSAPSEEQAAKVPLSDSAKDEAPQGDPQKDIAPTQQPQTVDTSVDNFVAPQVLHRENTLSTVASPSPIKESDKLREEIIRTLSPVRPSDGPGVPGAKEESTPTAGTLSRESTYLHGVYDDYWSASDDKAAHAMMDTIPESKPQTLQDNTELPEIQPLSPRLKEPATEQQLPVAETRPRRFSWEAESGPAASTGEIPAAVVVEPAAEMKPSESDEETPAAEKTEPFRAADELPSRVAENARINAPEDASQISHQVSQVSSLPRESNTAVPQPPSPISVASEKPSAEPKSLALTDEKALAASAAIVTPGNPIVDAEEGPSATNEPKWQQSEAQQGDLKQPELQQPESQQPQKILTFREILEMPNTADRIAKYNETRQQFANMDSGLNEWLVHIKTQPEHANASGSFQTLLQGDAQFGGTFGGPGQPPKSPTGAQPAPQQPYYQQYLNASSPTTSSAPGRNPLSGLTGGSPASDFKHSSGQVGAKGKELLLAAGKAGKGLLSKGKDKLRRDKNDEHSPEPAPAPAQQSQVKNDRRTSWAISLGTRSSTRDGPQPPQSHQHTRSVSDVAPQIPQPTRLSPFESDVSKESPWAAPPSSQLSKTVMHQRSDSQADELVSPVSETHSIPDRDHDVGGLSAPPAAGAGQIAQGARGAPTAQLAGGPKAENDDWVMVESPTVARNEGPPQAVYQGPAQYSQAQPPRRPEEESPTRKSSFIGLPPIRRGSTFGLNYTRRAKERFSLDEEDMHDPAVARAGQPGPSEPTDPRPSLQQDEGRRGSGTLVDADNTMVNTHQRDPTHDGQPEGTLGASTLGPRTSIDSDEVDVGEDPEKKPIPPPANPMPTQRRAPVLIPNTRTTLPEGNPVQHVPPQGWNLQQSHLSEPLLPASRNRQQLFAAPVANRQAAPPGQQQGAIQASAEEAPRAAPNAVPQAASRAAPQATPQPGYTQPGRQTVPQAVPQPAPQPDTVQVGPQPVPQGGPPTAPQAAPVQAGVPQPGPPQGGPGSVSQQGPPQAGPPQVGPSQNGPQQFGPPVRVPTAQMPPRQKFSETPPSSARRYPGLFSGVSNTQRPQQGPQGPQGPPAMVGPQGAPGLQGSQPGPRRSMDLPNNMYQQPLGRDQTMIQRSSTGEFQIPGMGPPEQDDRGRQRTSGFFKEIGNRFRSASRERRNSMAEQRPTLPPSNLNVQHNFAGPGDDVSLVSSVATEDLHDTKKKRRRSSFFMKFGGSKAGEDSTDDSPETRLADTPSQAPAPAHGQADQSEKRRSFFGTPLGGSSVALPVLSRTSTMSNANETEGSVQSQTPKKRISAFTGKLFSRSSNQQEEISKPGTSQSMTPSLHSRHSAIASTQPAVPSPLAAQARRERSNTTDSAPGLNRTYTNHSLVSADSEEDRGRRVSATKLLSIFNRSSSKNRDQKPQPQRLPRQQEQANQPQGQFGPPQQVMMNRPPGHFSPPQQGQPFPPGQQLPPGPLQQFPPGQGPPFAPGQGQQMPPGQRQPFPPGQGQMGPPRQLGPPGNAPPGSMQAPQPRPVQIPQGPLPPGDQPPSAQGPPPGFKFEQPPQPTQTPPLNQMRSPVPTQNQSPPSVGSQGPQLRTVQDTQPGSLQGPGPVQVPPPGQQQWRQSPPIGPGQPQFGQQPPPFRTQGPPVHPVASVSPPNRNRAVFPDLQRPAEQQPTVKGVAPEPVEDLKTSSPALDQRAQVVQPGPVVAPPSIQPSAQQPQGSAPVIASPQDQQSPIQPPPRSQLRDEEMRQNGAATASSKPFAVSPSSSPDLTAGGTAQFQPPPAAPDQAEQKAPVSQPVVKSENTIPTATQPPAGPGQQPAQPAQQGDAAPLAPTLRQMQNPSIRKPIGANRLSVVPQQRSVSQSPPTDQLDRRESHLSAASSQGPSERSSVTAGQADPRISQVSSVSPPQSQQNGGSWGQGPMQRPSSMQQNASPPQGMVGPQGRPTSQGVGPQGQPLGQPQSSAGAQGKPGVPGLQGQPGSLGVAGPHGMGQPMFRPNSQGVPGPQRMAVPQGMMGPQSGPQGVMGPQGRPGAPGQQPPQPFLTFQNEAPAPAPAPQPQQEKSSVMKWFKGKSSEQAPQQPPQQPQTAQAPQRQGQPQPQPQPQAHPQQQQQPPEKKKDKSGKSLFGAFKRSSKQAEAQTQQAPPPQQMAGPQGQFYPQQPGMQGQMPPNMQQQQQMMMMQQQQGRPAHGMQQPQGMQQGQQQLQQPQQQPQQQSLIPGQTQTPPPQGTPGQTPPPTHPPQQGEERQGGSPPYLQYQQERMSPDNAPVIPGQGRPGSLQQRPSYGSGQTPPLQQRSSFGPGQGPPAQPQQRQSFGPGPGQVPPHQLQQRPSFGPGQQPPQPPQQGGVGPGQLQQRQSFGPGPGQMLPQQLQQRPSFGPGQMQQQAMQPQFGSQGPVQNLPPGASHAQAQQQMPRGWYVEEEEVERQYEPVPIPKGYIAVHGEGTRVDQSPYDVGRVAYVSPQLGSQAQFQSHHVAAPHQPMHNYPQHPSAWQGNQQQAYPPQQAPPQQYLQQQPQQQQQYQPPQPPNQLGIQQSQPAQPQGQPIQQSEIIQSTTAAPPSNPQPAPQNPQVAEPAPSHPPQRADQVSTQPSAPAKTSPEPSTPARRNLSVNIQSANDDVNDDLYNATPRKPLEPQKTGESQISVSSNEERARKANGAAKKAKAKVTRVNSTRAELEDTEDERKRSIRLEAQEEKILYDPLEDGPGAGKRKGDDADAPQMSATSYPGMEWNPYASGNYEDWND